LSGLSKKNIETSLKFVYSDNNSLSVIFHDNDLLMGVVGEFNKNLKELEKITGSSLYSRGKFYFDKILILKKMKLLKMLFNF
jgi:phosphate starvation-inducible PhoH-like protein